MSNPGLSDYLKGLADTCSMSKCTQESHNALKTSNTWQTLVYIGIQEGCPEYDLELRNCKCGSTLAKRISPKK